MVIEFAEKKENSIAIIYSKLTLYAGKYTSVTPRVTVHNIFIYFIYILKREPSVRKIII